MGKSFTINPDLVRARCLSARLLAQMSPERAAKKMGYSNTSMISKMEKKTSKTSINHNYIARASLCYGVSVDYLLGLSDYPERDPRSVEQLAIYASVRQFADGFVNSLSEAIIEGAQSHMLSGNLAMLCDDAQALIDAFTRCRELNAKFDDKIKGGATMLKCAEQLTERVKSTRMRLSKAVRDENIIRQFRAVLNDKQEDFIGFNYGN